MFELQMGIRFGTAFAIWYVSNELYTERYPTWPSEVYKNRTVTISISKYSFYFSFRWLRLSKHLNVFQIQTFRTSTQILIFERIVTLQPGIDLLVIFKKLLDDFRRSNGMDTMGWTYLFRIRTYYCLLQ